MKINRNKKFILSLIIFVILAVTAWYFIQSKKDKSNKSAAKESPSSVSRVQIENGVTTIDLSPSEQVNSGITTTKLVQTLHQVQLAAYGSVVSIQELAKDVQSFEADKALLEKSRENLLIAQKNFERIESLYKKNLTSEQDYQASQAAFFSDKADVNSAFSSLVSQKSSILEQWGYELSNWIFNNTAKLQRLLLFNDVLIQISLPSNEMNIKTPASILINSPSGTGNKIPCRFISEGHHTNSQFQTKTLYYIASNSSLSGGMNIKAFLPIGRELPGVIVRDSSIVWYQGKAWIYKEMSSNKFNRVSISVDNPIDNGYFVPNINGIIIPGVVVVKSGAQLLLSEELTPTQGSQSGGGDDD